MILIYTPIISSRVRYVFKHIFTRILLIEIDFTTKVEDFVAYSGAKISYAKVPLGGEFFIKSHDLLFEQSIRHIDINVLKWDNVPCFFLMGKKSSVPYDIFAASFFLISRYEEYLAHSKDNIGRFKATESLAFKNNFLEKPVVDIWAYKLLTSLKEKFPNIEHKKRKFNYVSLIDIDEAFLYKHKGIIDAVINSVRDLLKLKIYRVVDRFSVIFNIKRDPYKVFNRLIRLKNKYDIETIFFFLIGKQQKFSAKLPSTIFKYQLLIKDMVDYARVGLYPSFETKTDSSVLKEEKNIMEEITHMPMICSRQYLMRFEIPKTYQNLIDLEISEDFSMAYESHVGFRASTCTPFYFYDIDFEIQTPLKINSVAFTDKTLKKHLALTPKQSLGKIKDLKKQVKGVNGTFISVFNNTTISGYDKWSGWGSVYEAMLKIVIDK